MAKIQFAGIGGAVSGTINGVVYSHNRFGPYTRDWKMPVNPQSARQETIRQLMQSLTTRWSQTLTQLQRDEWDTYAENITVLDVFGNPIHLTGFNHFLRSNIARLQDGAAVVDDGPSIFELPEADPTFAITISEATQLVSVTFDNALAWANEPGGHLCCFMGYPQNPQRTFFAGPWRFMASVDGADITPPTSPDDQACQWPVAAGQRVWAYARISRADGRLSEPFRGEIIVAA